MCVFDDRPNYVLFRSWSFLWWRYSWCKRWDAQMGAWGEPWTHFKKCDSKQKLCIYMRAQSIHAHPFIVFRQNMRHSAQRPPIPWKPCAVIDIEIRHWGWRRRWQTRVWPNPILPSVFAVCTWHHSVSQTNGPKRAHPVEDYFDDLSMHLVYEMYKRNFDLFKYDAQDPSNKMPIGEIDLDEVHAKLGD